jgi:hypothetical protein
MQKIEKLNTEAQRNREMPEKRKNDVSLLRKYVAETAMVLALVWVILGVMFFAAGWTPKPLSGLYLIYAVRDRTFLALACAVSPIFTLIMTVIVSVIALRYRSCLIVGLMVAGSILFCAGAVPAVMTETYHDRLFAGDYVYYADSEWRDEDDTHLLWFVVRRCDSLGVMCTSVYAKPYYNRHDSEIHGSFDAHLIHESGSVIFKFKGKVVYAEQP